MADLFRSKALLGGVALLIIFIGVWALFIVPQLLALDDRFEYTAELTSVDNFYDETVGGYLGKQYSVTTFSYDVIDETDEGLVVRNIFDVRTQSGDPIFAVERFYGVDPYTHEHITGLGDKDRNGYLFAPRQLEEGESFTYWHINYDGPAEMKFIEEEYISGLRVFHYQSTYEGVPIDQTENLTYLPGVPEERGIVLEPVLDLWVEPVTGRLIKYQDNTVAYYYDQETGEKIHPWNNFENVFTEQSVREQVQIAQSEKIQFQFLYIYVPVVVIILFFAWVLFISSFGKRGREILSSRKSAVSFAILPIIGGLVVLIGWAAHIDRIKYLLPGGSGMNPLTALLFSIIGLGILAALFKKWIYVGILSAVVLVVGFLQAVSLIWFPANTFDLFLFTEAVEGAVSPSRMSLFTSVCFVLLGGALSMYSLVKKTSQSLVLAPLSVLALSIVALIAYGFPDLQLLGLGIFVSVAFHTALLFVVCSISLLNLFEFRIKSSNIIVLGTTVFSLLLTFVLSAYAGLFIQQQLESTFLVETEQIENAILNRVGIYASTLSGGVGLFNASENVERQEFKQYVDVLEIQRFYPGIQGIGYAIVVEDEEELIESVRSEGFSEFSVYPESEQDLRTSVIYLEPFDFRNQRAFGYDMFSEENRRNAMSRARDTGVPSVSGKVTLLQETENDVQAGFLMYLPVYSGGVGLNTVVERRDQLEGFVYSPFRMRDFMEGILPSASVSDIDFHIYDGLSTTEEDELYDADNGVYSRSEDYEPEFVRTEVLYVGGQPWTVEFISLPSFGLSTSDRLLPLGILLGGTMVSLLVAIVLYVVLASRERIAATRGLQLGTLMDNLPFGVLIEDEQRQVVLVNQRVVDIFGSSSTPSELQGVNACFGEELLSSGMQEKFKNQIEHVEAIVDAQKVVTDEKVTMPGGKVFTRSYVPLFRDGHYSGAIWTYKDITKQNEIDEMKTDFVSMVSHQLKTPVAQIKGYVSNMMDGLTGRVTKKQMEYLEDMLHVANQNGQLIDDLLNVSRIERGVIKVDADTISVNETIEEIISPLVRVAKAKGIKLEVGKLQKDVILKADEGKIIESIRNIVDNALKFTPKGKTVALSASDAKEAVVITVSDEGPGIDKDVQTELFQKERVWSGKVKASGTGLGLYLAKKFITLQGGTITFKTGPGGTVFTITLKK